jgi:hypothetical protein
MNMSLLEDDVVGTIYRADNIDVLRTLPSESVDLIYIDPPFNTGKVQERTQLKTVRSESGDRVGFQGHRYESIVVGKKRFADLFDDYLAFLEPRLVEAHRVLAPHGCLYVHLDYREVHYCKVLLDAIFDRACFLNEIIWAYDYGGRPRDRWPPKHDTILLYAKVPGRHVFNWTQSSASRTWRRDWSDLRRRRAGNCQPIHGGIRLCQPTVRRRPGIRPRSRWGFSAGSFRHRLTQGQSCSTSSPAAGRQG